MPRNKSRIIYIDPITPKLAAASALADEIVDGVLEFESTEAQNDMRANAPWTDRTGNARQGLFAQNYVSGDEHGIVLYHTMPYGIFLETRWSGRYRIIYPSVIRCGRQVMQALRGALKAL